jgi:hypothetical protein
MAKMCGTLVEHDTPSGYGSGCPVHAGGPEQGQERHQPLQRVLMHSVQRIERRRALHARRGHVFCWASLGDQGTKEDVLHQYQDGDEGKVVHSVFLFIDSFMATAQDAWRSA